MDNLNGVCSLGALCISYTGDSSFQGQSLKEKQVCKSVHAHARTHTRTRTHTPERLVARKTDCLFKSVVKSRRGMTQKAKCISSTFDRLLSLIPLLAQHSCRFELTTRETLLSPAILGWVSSNGRSYSVAPCLFFVFFFLLFYFLKNNYYFFICQRSGRA